MSMARDYLDKYNELMVDIKVASERLNGLQSLYDRKVSALYHEIEKTDFNEASGFELARDLKRTLQERRIIKDECMKINAIYNTIKQSIEPANEQYSKAARKGDELRVSLNTKLNAEEVLVAALAAE